MSQNDNFSKSNLRVTVLCMFHGCDFDSDHSDHYEVLGFSKAIHKPPCLIHKHVPIGHSSVTHHTGGFMEMRTSLVDSFRDRLRSNHFFEVLTWLQSRMPRRGHSRAL